MNRLLQKLPVAPTITWLFVMSSLYSHAQSVDMSKILESSESDTYCGVDLTGERMACSSKKEVALKKNGHITLTGKTGSSVANDIPEKKKVGFALDRPSLSDGNSEITDIPDVCALRKTLPICSIKKAPK